MPEETMESLRQIKQRITISYQLQPLEPDSGIWWVGLGISLEALGKQQQTQRAYARACRTGTLSGDLAQITDNRLLALDAINYPIN